MPEVTKITDLRAARPNPTPDYTLPGVRRLNSYDEGFRKEMNQEWNRANNQTWNDQLWKGFISRGASVATKIVGGVGSLYGAAGALLTDKELDYIWTNPISQAMNNADESLRESLPVYKSRKYTEGDLLRKMATTGFWFDDAFDGIAYLGSAYAGGSIGKGIATGIRAGAKATGDLGGMSKKVADGLKKVGATAYQGDMAAATAYNTIAEASAEAYQTQQEVELLLNQLRDTHPDYQNLTDEDIKGRAAKSASETFWLNSATIAIPNLIQNRMLHMDWPNRSKEVRKSIWDNAGETSKALEQTVSRWKEVGAGFASEGLWEENIQTAIQQYERAAGANLKGDNEMAKEIGGHFANNIKGFVKSFLPGFTTDSDENEGAISIFLGGLIGGGMGVYSAHTQNKTLRDAVKKESERYGKLFKEYGPAAENLFTTNVASIYEQNGITKTTVEDKEVEVPNYLFENGELKKSSDAILKMVTNQLKNKHLFDSQILAAYKSDPVMDEYNKQVALAAYVYDLSDKGYSTEEINSYLDQIGTTASEEAKQLGVQTYAQDNIAQAKEYAKTFENIATSNASKEDLEAQDIDEAQFKNFLNKTTYYTAVKRKALENIRALATKPSTLESIDALLEDVTTVQNELNNEKQGIRDEYFATVAPTKKLMAEYAQLNTTKDRTPEQQTRFEQLDYLLKEHSAINGNAVAYNTSYNNTYGATNKQLVSIGKPGTRQDHYYNLGRQSLALEQTKQNIAAGEDPLTTADALLDYAYHSDGEFRAVLDPLVDSISGDLDNLYTVAEDMETAWSETLSYMQGELSVGELNEATIVALEAILPVNDNGGIDFDAYFDPETTDKDLFQAVVDKLRSDMLKTAERVAKSMSVIQRANELEKQDAQVDRRQAKISGDKADDYLIRDFYVQAVAGPVRTEIRNFESNSDEYYDIDTINREIQRLRMAKAAFTNREGLGFDAIRKSIDKYLDILSNEILPKIIANRESRRAKQVETNNSAVNGILSAIGVHRGVTPNRLVSDLFKEVLGDEKFNEAIATVVGDDELLSYDGAIAVITSFKTQANEEQLAKLKQLLSADLNQLLGKMEEIIISNTTEKKLLPPKSYLTPALSKDNRSLYEVNPQNTLVSLMRRLFSKEVEKGESLVYKYMHDHDIFALVNSLERDKVLNASQKEVIKAIYNIHVRTNELAKILNLTLNIEKDFGAIIAAKNSVSKDVQPTPQQNIVLTDALSFYFDGQPTGQLTYEGWMLIKGIAGTGKSHLIGHQLTRLIKALDKDAGVYAFSGSPFTSKNINEAVHGVGNAPKHTLDTFLALSDKQLEDIKFLIIDEVFTIPADTLKQVSNKIKDSKLNIKVFALGDPSQLSASEDTHPLMTAHGIRAKQTFALSVSYRTNVGAISSFISNYQMNPEDVTSGYVQSSKSFAEAELNMSDTLGVQSGDISQMLRLLAAPSSRSRVVIVSNDIDKQSLLTQTSPGVPVLTISEAQGYQWDEVYTYLDKGVLGGRPIDVNKALYTAFSRAKSYLYVTGLGISNLDSDPNLSSSVDESAQDIVNNALDFKSIVEKGARVISILTGTAPVGAPTMMPTPTVVNDEEEHFDAGPIDEEIIPQEVEDGNPSDMLPVESAPVSVEGSYIVAHPTNYNYRSIFAGANVHIMRSKDTKGKDYYYQVSPIGNGMYGVVGMLGNNDFNDETYGNFFQATIQNKPGVYIPKDRIVQQGFTIPDIDAISLGTGTLTNYRPMSNTYDRNEDGAPDYRFENNLVENQLTHFYNSFFGKDALGRRLYPDEVLVRDTQGNPVLDNKGNPTLDVSKEWIVNGKVNWAVAGKHMRIHIFDRKNLPSPYLYVGIPYMEIINPRQLSIDTKSATASKSIYIPLQPKKFNKTSKQYTPIKKLYDALVSLGDLVPELTLGGETLPLVVEDFAKNFVLEDSGNRFERDPNLRFKINRINNPVSGVLDLSPEMAAEVFPLLEQVVRLIYAPDLRKVFLDSKEEADAAVDTVIDGKEIVGYRETKNGKFILQYKGDTEGEDTPDLRIYQLRAGRGEAQRALNVVAQANKHLADNSGLVIPLRIEVGDEERQGFKLTRARSILSTAGNYIDYASLYDAHPHWNVNVGMFKSQQELKAHLLNNELITAEEFDKAILNHTNRTMTLGILDLIVGDNFYDQSNNHNINGFYLREPLDSRTPSGTGINDIGSDLTVKENRNKLSSALRTAYRGTQQTQVAIKYNTTSQPVKEAINSFPTTNSHEVLKNRNLPKGEAYLYQLRDLLLKGTTVPIVYDRLPKLRNKRGGAYDPGTNSIRANFNILEDSTVNSILLMHEILHANTGQAILRASVGAGSDADRLLYSRIQGIRQEFISYIDRNSIKLQDVTNATPGEFDENEFVANLSHPEFVKTLKKIKVKETSLLKQVMLAILDLFGITENSNLHEVLFNSLEKFLTTEQIVVDAEPLRQEFKKLAMFTPPAVQNVYREIYDFGKGDFTDQFNAAEPATQIAIIQSILNEDTEEQGDSVFYGLLTPTSIFYSSNPGSLTTNKGLYQLYSSLVDKTDNTTTKDFIITVLSQQIKNPSSKLLANIIQYKDDIDSLMSLVFESVLTNPDKRIIREELDIKPDEVLIALQNIDNRFTDLIQEGVNIIASSRAELEYLVGNADTFSTKKYEIARNYIVNKIKDNKNNPVGLIKTKEELLGNILSELRNPDGLVKEINEEFERKIALAATFAAQIADGNTSKIGLYKKLIEETIPSIEQRLAAMSSLVETNQRTGTLLFYDIVADVYPKSRYSDDEDLEIFQDRDDDAARETRDDKEANSTGISEHQKKYNKSYEITLSESVKDFLALVSVGDRLLNPSLVYIKTLQYLTSVDANNLSKLQRQINETLSDKGLSDIDRAIYTNLQELISTATNKFNPYTNTTLPINVSIITSTNEFNVVTYRAVYSITEDVSNITEMSAKMSSLIDISPAYRNSNDLYNWLNAKTPILNTTYNALFARAEAINALREVTNVMSSMKETELMVGTRTNRKGIEVAYIRSKAIGIATSTKATITDTLESLHRDKKLSGIGAYFARLYEEESAAIFGTKKGNYSIQNKKDAIKAFFNILGLSNLTSGLTIDDENVADLIEKIEFFANKAKEVKLFGEEEDVDTSELSDSEFEDTKGSFGFFLKDLDARINTFAETASKSSIFLRNPSVRSASGEKFYKFHESSWAYDIMLNLIRMKKVPGIFSGTKGGNEFRRAPEYLKTSFYDHNIFKTGLSSVTFMAEHEALKNTDNNVVTLYTRESKFHYFQRELVQGFIDGARQYQGKEYFLFNYTPSDKPKTPLFKVSLLSDKGEDSQIKKGIRAALQQFIDKEGINLDVAYYNESNSKDRFRNFTLAKIASENLKASLTTSNIGSYVDEIHRLLEEEAVKLTNELIEVKETFDVNTFNNLEKSFSSSINEKFNIESLKGKFRSYNNAGDTRTYNVTKDMILPIVDLYVKNHYVNTFHLHQLFTGDYAAYKGSSSEIVKRMAGMYGPGIRGLVDPEIGMKDKFEVLVLQDTKVEVETTKERLHTLIFGEDEPSAVQLVEFNDLMNLFDDYDIADAQGFMLPKRYADMERGFGRGWGLGNVMKPVHFELIEKTFVRPDGTTYTTAIPVYLKYSSIVLSDELVRKFPSLSRIRTKLEVAGVDELIFHTGVKTGIPLVRDSEGNRVHDKNFSYTLDEFMALEDSASIRTFQTSPIVTLSNQYFRLQHNPATDPRKNVAIYTQLMYFLNVYENTFDAARSAYSLVGELIELGREKFMDESSKDFKTFLQKKFKGPGSERALELLKAGVSINNPLLEKKAIISLASGLEEATVKVKFPGGKLVLQTSQGIYKYQDPDLFSNIDETLADELAYKSELIDVDGVPTRIFYAEVIVPEELLTNEQVEAVKRKESVFLYGDGMGFRIPSSELHSAVPLRIVGVYSNTKTNVVIAPKEIVPIQGSDFDVDALFVIIRENFTKEDVTRLTTTQVEELVNSLSDMYNSIEEIEKSLEQGEAAEFKRFRNLLLQKFDLEGDLDTLAKQEMSFEFQRDVLAQYNEAVASQPTLTREDFALLNGYTYSNGIFRMQSSIAADLMMLDNDINKFTSENPTIVKKSRELSSLFSRLKANVKNAKKMKGEAMLINVDKSIGYTKVKGKYVLDPNFLDSINEELAQFEVLFNSIESNGLMPYLLPKIKKEISRLKDIKVKYIKNSVTETMLKTISNHSNIQRIVSPIAFTPLRNSLKKIPQEMRPSKELDLSNPRQKYDSYRSLADGQILTGAFANAVKDFGYVSRAGNQSAELSGYYNELRDLSLRIKYFGNIPDEQLTKQALLNRKKVLSTKVQKVLSESPNKEERPFINPAYEFSLNISGNNYSFNGFIEKDVLGQYGVTTIFDSLLNAAIDNLKMGLLPELKINTLTGSSVIGMVSLGVPIDNIVQILYSPILKPLSTGTVDRLSTWSTAMEEKYATQFATLQDKYVKGYVLSDKDIVSAINSNKELSAMTDSELMLQIAVLDVFLKGNKIGEDMRNLATFLNIIRQMEVFVEDLDGVDTDLKSKIGAIEEVNGELVLIPNTDFSMIIPNLFRNNPHIRQAYISHRALVDRVNELFLIHSDEIRTFVKGIPYNSLHEDEEIQDTVSNLAHARRSVAHMLLSSLVWDDVSSEPMTTVKLGEGRELVLSKARSFSERVARQLKEIQSYVKDNPEQFKIPNRFLDLTSISKNNQTNTLAIRLIGGVNLNSIDIQDISRGFRMLNQFEFINGKLVKLPPNQSISQLQQDLLTYAVINYGLQFSTSNFSNVIDSRLISNLDEQFNNELKKFIKNAADETASKAAKDFFLLSYHMMNSSRLGFVPFNNVETIGQVQASDGKVLRRHFSGKDTIEADGQSREVHFDRKVKKSKNASGTQTKNPQFFSVDYKKKTEVFVNVDSSDTHDYYQKLGKVSEAFYTKMSDTKYSKPKYFNPAVRTLDYNMILPTGKEGSMRILTSTYLSYLKPGDEFYIVPAYNFDRQERVLVRLKSPISESLNKKFLSYQYDVEIIPFTEVVEIPEVVEPVLPPVPTQEDPAAMYAYLMDDVVKDGESLQNTDDRMGYIHKPTGKVLDGITGVVIPAMRSKQFGDTTVTRGEREANKLWEKLDPSAKLLTSIADYEVTKEEYQQLVDTNVGKGVAKGTIFHKIMHLYFTRDSKTSDEISALMQEQGFLPGEFEWVFDNIGGIVYKTGSDYFKRHYSNSGIEYRVNESALDKIYTEVPVFSLELGMAGTMDLVVDHGDDLYSLFDLKTGANFNRLLEFDMFKYGSTSTEDIFVTPRSKAKMQLMWYAIMMKVKRPDARFKSIELLHIKNRHSIYDTDFRRNINYPAYLEMIEKYLKVEKPEAYKALKALPHFKEIFDPSTYGVITKDVLDKPDIDPAQDLKLKTLRLQSLIMMKRNLGQSVKEGDPESVKIMGEIKSLMDDIIALRSMKGMNMASWDRDISWMDKWLGSPSSSTNPYVQLYYQQLAKQKDAAEAKVKDWHKEYDPKLKALVAEYRRNNSATIEETVGRLTKNFIGGINKQKLFAFAYKTEKFGEDELVKRFVTELDSEWNSLTDTQKRFLTFIQDSVEKFFIDDKSDYTDARTGRRTALANKVVTTRIVKGQDKDLTNLDLFNGEGNIRKPRPFVYSRGFIPRVAQTIDDIKTKHGIFSKEMLEFARLKYTTNYYEAMYDGWFDVDETIPMKYLGGYETDINQNFTTDIDLMMSNFVREYTYKEHMEEVYAYGVGTKLYLQAKEEADSNINFSELVEWFETSIDLHVLGVRERDLNLRQREMRKNTERGFMKFSWGKFLRSLKSFFASSTMWLKPIAGTANFVFASLYSLKEGVRGTVSNKMYGTDKDNADFGIIDILKGFAAATKMLVADAITGTTQQNKLYLLMDKYRYFNDSYDWYVNPNRLFTGKNKLFSSRSMYAFHTYPEEVISAAVFYAQMNAMKTADGKSMLDHYEVVEHKDENGEITHSVQWDGYVRGERNISNIDGATQIKPVTELEPEEIIAIRQLYERMHGGYKTDERVRAEYFIMGELILQFKKYLPSILKNGFASKGVRQSQGFFKPNDKGVLEWTPAVIEGRFYTLAYVFLNLLGQQKDGSKGNKFMKWMRLQSNESYDWDKLSKEQKDNLVDGMVTMFGFLIMLFGYASLWDRDDQDATKKVYGRIMNDFAGQWWLPELTKNVANLSQPVAARKTVKLLDSSTELGMSLLLLGIGETDASITKQGNLRGWPEFQRNWPFLSSYHDIEKFIKESENSDILDLRMK